MKFLIFSDIGHYGEQELFCSVLNALVRKHQPKCLLIVCHVLKEVGAPVGSQEDSSKEADPCLPLNHVCRVEDDV